MNCLKCGRDIDPEQVFCPECLADMEKYPVRPGTAVQLPRRSETPLNRKSHQKRRPPTAEEQIKRLRKTIRVLVGMLIVTIVLAAVLAYPYVADLLDGQDFLPGQNWTSSVSTAPTDPTGE